VLLLMILALHGVAHWLRRGHFAEFVRLWSRPDLPGLRRRHPTRSDHPDPDADDAGRNVRLMCQFCKRQFATIWEIFTMKEYAGKFYHPDCFAKVEQIAMRTGGVL
jgi:hypothetical protein